MVASPCGEKVLCQVVRVTSSTRARGGRLGGGPALSTFPSPSPPRYLPPRAGVAVAVDHDPPWDIAVARELLVDCDDARRRLVYAVISERVKQHSASVQVVPDGDARTRLIWIVDVLPNEIAPYIGAQMDQAALAMQNALSNPPIQTVPDEPPQQRRASVPNGSE